MKLWFKKGAWAPRRARETIGALAPAEVRRIAVIRHAALGDMMLTRPFLVELRKTFPHADITLSLAPNYQRGAPSDLVDRLHVLGRDTAEGLRIGWRDFQSLGKQDLLFDLASTSRSRLLTLLTPARLKFGFPYRQGFLEKRLYDVMVLRSDMVFEAEACLHMLNMLGITTATPPDFALDVPPYDHERPYVLYFAGASHPGKCWPRERLAALVEQMAAGYPGHDHLVLGGLQSWESAEPVVKMIRAENVRAVRSPELDGTIALAGHADLVVSNDTSIRHIAIAAGTPTVGIFFSCNAQMPQLHRYLPRFGAHLAALEPDGSPPAVHRVLGCCTSILGETRR